MSGITHFADSPRGTLCNNHFRTSRSMMFTMQQVNECPDCQEARDADKRRIQETHTIDKTRVYGEHIALTCKNHPTLTWSTKNIDYIGARSIFFTGSPGTECACSGADLIVKDS